MRRLIPAVAAALLALVLLAPAAKAAEVPPLVTTSQYKALVGYVEKLDRLSHTPATASKKASYEDRLENKHDAAVDKATALFDRGKKVAQLESQRQIDGGVQTIRRTEAGELAALRKDYDAQMDRAADDYDHALARVEDLFDRRNANLRRQITRLRKQAAEAEGSLGKALIHEAIDRRTKRLGENRKLEQEEVADLKAGYAREKDAIRGGKRSATLSLRQNDAEAIATLRKRGKRIYNSTLHTLQARRVNQLNDLERKLNAGRAAIGRIPAAA
jgi:hypothetical protein